MNFTEVEAKLLNFLEISLKETGLKNFIVGISGGLDSAVVSALCSKVSAATTYGLILPANILNTNSQNLKDAKNHCEKFGIDYEILHIDSIILEFEKKLSNLTDLRRGNLAARIRMCILYDYSAKKQAVVVGTSNLSERLLGYGTVYGDMACAFNPIGKIFKTEIFEFAKFLKIDENIIKKAPSADLWEGQSDEKDLGYTYAQLDEILKKIYNTNFDYNELTNEYGIKIVDFILNRIKSNTFKLQMPKIADVR